MKPISIFATALFAYVIAMQPTVLAQESNSASTIESTKQTIVKRNSKVPFVKQLAAFESYLGGWTSTFDTLPGQPKVVDVTLFEKVLNGRALRTTHSINDGDYGGESYVFWNNQTERLEFHYFTTAEFMTTVAYEKVTGKSQVSQGITKVRSISELAGDSMTVSTSYLKNGEWTKPAMRKYSRTNKPVVFK
jgi:hypothetical protein